jgi:hypothetical protein
MIKCFPKYSWMVQVRPKPLNSEDYNVKYEIVFGGLPGYHVAKAAADELESNRSDLQIYVCQNN